MSRPDERAAEEEKRRIAEELEAMAKIANALVPLSPRMRQAVLDFTVAWLEDRRERDGR